MNLLLTQAELEGVRRDVRVHDGIVNEVAARLRPAASEEVVDAGGAALLPGLHDHHIHLLATAAAMTSVQCRPPNVHDRASLASALRSAPGNGWIRGVGYSDDVAGPLDRNVLDGMLPDRPVRVQHRTGGLWVLNSLALQRTGLDQSGDHTGRLWRFDTQLRARLDSDGDIKPDLRALARRLNGYGVTGVTDATPDLDAAAVALLAELPLDLVLLGAPDDVHLPGSPGPRKMLLHDHDLPDLDALVARIERSHAHGRPVAVHCVTRESLVLTVLAIESAGYVEGDRIEHAAVVPPELIGRIAALGLAVVTQPSFVALRGDDYLRDVAADDVECLYPYASLLSGGVCVAPSSDAPYGDLDPWRTLVAARDRRTRRGAAIAPHERVEVLTALRGFLSPLLQPGSAPRSIRPGVVADLCLLDASLREVVAEPDADRVRLVLRRGEAVS